MNRYIKKFFNGDSILDLVKHFVIIGIIGILLIFLLFNAYMPFVTSHGESITVPDIIGLGYDDLDEFLTDRSLRFEVNEDSGYSVQYPPFAVLKQYPEAGQKVKENRKIFITLNAQNPPDVKMPKLKDGSLKNAEIVLENYGLIRGDIIYEPDPMRNAVLDMLYDEESIEEGTPLPKGSIIDLVVGDGVGKIIFEMPEIIGMEVEEAKILILGSSLVVGEINYIDAPDEVPGTVIDQSPKPEIMVRIGRRVNLWVAGVGNSTDSQIVE